MFIVKKILPSKRRTLGWLFLLACLFLLSACGSGGKKAAVSPGFSQSNNSPIIMADGDWDSIQVHNRLAGLIIENGYGYPVEYLSGEDSLTWQSLSHGDLDIIMEIWSVNNQAVWESIYKNNSVRVLGINYTGAEQGWYVPAYLIEGDVERGIEALAPYLKSVQDLNRYSELFGFSDGIAKATIHNSPPGWNSTVINQDKFKAYRLAKNFELKSSSSYQDLEKSLAYAYKKAVPWVGYGFSPDITAKYKMTLLQEPTFNQSQWKTTHACAYPETDVLIAVNRGLLEKAPEVVDFLSKYKTNLEQNEEMLRYMAEHKGDKDATALYFLNKYPDVWKEWVPEAIALQVEQGLSLSPQK